MTDSFPSEQVLTHMSIEQIKLRIRNEIRRGCGSNDIPQTVITVLMSEGIDLRKGPSLEEVKRILVDAYRTADAARCVAC